MLKDLSYDEVRKKCDEISETYQINEELFYGVIEDWDGTEKTINDKLQGVFQSLLKVVSNEITTMEDKVSLEATCQMGCAFCCYFPIIITKLESKLLQMTINNFDSERKEKLYNHIEQYFIKYKHILEQVPDNTDEEIGEVKEAYKKLQLPCVLLDTETNQCMAYEVRPIPCRTYMSYSDPLLCKENLLPKETVSFEFLYEPYISALNEFLQWAYEDGNTGKITYPNDLYETDYLFNWMSKS
ncbi:MULTISPECIES: YkgJ family cysteine cluster protein [Oceanobacillus]|uniref:YkgJ family cysteine cluster protein n=1 Tax=Oceanobacillus kimchii TaxID=746691 RepID=A0ABQ5TJ75_9BACI|nr:MULTISPECIES: YkgJ family cysteine cluster protein [Oceanobacillus]MBT2600743.1 YkgJ family cysteine cluster protein [Oceanobacillus sp. ISL-74]MBT2650860.1 YkgJ family cysteine cluster protein [Oceanobacillus sp. ISL-73]MCT1575498.1 YkgJ family cysteine cluster protein [Oceanobacillus kimchii]MCT2138071.1 YkgJ family cysteine cluster protein [Oceanobacillus kimchii]OEH55315.1 hypothetical protein AQ616_03840 [Oceanobacillus sp. E9]